MNNLAVYKIKILPVLLLILTAFMANAQSAARDFSFKKGDQYYRQTAIKSSCIIQMGKTQVHINSNSLVAKAYDIVDVNDKGYVFTVTPKKITNALDVDNKHLDFDSAKPSDNQSMLAKGLNFMIGKSTRITIDKHGVITFVEPPTVKYADDALLAFTGIANEQFVVGNRFGLISDFLMQGKLDKNYTWGDTTANGDNKVINKFWVQNQTATATTIGFSSSVTGKMANTNTNGVYVLDNATGVITQRILQSVSVGYIYFKNNIYGSTRRWAISESCTKSK